MVQPGVPRQPFDRVDDLLAGRPASFQDVYGDEPDIRGKFGSPSLRQLVVIELPGSEKEGQVEGLAAGVEEKLLRPQGVDEVREHLEHLLSRPVPAHPEQVFPSIEYELARVKPVELREDVGSHDDIPRTAFH